MGVMMGAHEYIHRESQMGHTEQYIRDMLNEIQMQRYSKDQFVKDYINIASALGFIVDKSLDGKALILALIKIKLNHGEAAMRLELQKINRQRRQI